MLSCKFEPLQLPFVAVAVPDQVQSSSPIVTHMLLLPSGRYMK